MGSVLADRSTGRSQLVLFFLASIPSLVWASAAHGQAAHTADEIDYTEGSTGAVTRSLDDRLADRISVLDFGADPTDTADDRDAIVDAIAAASPGGAVYFPAGEYYLTDLDSDGTITVENVALVGEGVANGRLGYNSGFVLENRGATFVISSHSSNPAFGAKRFSTFRNLGFYYPDQTSTPVDTDAPTIRIGDPTDDVQFVRVENSAFLNSYHAIDIDANSTGGVGHVWITQNGIYGIRWGVTLDYNTEIITIADNNFTSSVPGPALNIHTSIDEYTYDYGIAIEVENSDGLTITGNMFHKYRRGLYVTGDNTVKKGVGLSSISDNRFDNCLEGIRTDGANACLDQVSIVNNTIFAVDLGDNSRHGYGIRLTGDCDAANATHENKAVISGNYFGQTSAAHISCANDSEGMLTITGNTFEKVGQFTSAWNTAGGDPQPATLSLSCEDTDVVFTGNLVSDEGVAGPHTFHHGVKTYGGAQRIRDLVIGSNIFRNKSSAIDTPSGTFANKSESNNLDN